VCERTCYYYSPRLRWLESDFVVFLPPYVATGLMTEFVGFTRLMCLPRGVHKSMGSPYCTLGTPLGVLTRAWQNFWDRFWWVWSLSLGWFAKTVGGFCPRDWLLGGRNTMSCFCPYAQAIRAPMGRGSKFHLPRWPHATLLELLTDQPSGTWSPFKGVHGHGPTCGIA
jgi:hypothetical protein